MHFMVLQFLDKMFSEWGGIRAIFSVHKGGGGDSGKIEVFCAVEIFRKIGVKSTFLELQKTY